MTVANGPLIHILKGHTGAVTRVAVSSEGLIYSGSDDNTVRVWNPETCNTICSLIGHSGTITSIAVLPDGRVVTGSNDKTLRICSLESA